MEDFPLQYKYLRRASYMKKALSILLSILIIIPSSVALAADGYAPPADEITKAEAYQFADELKSMNFEEYDVSNRLIISANKDIDYLNAVDVATGIEGLYVLQFPDIQSANEAYSYYDSLSYVDYVEYDSKIENPLCSMDTNKNSLQNTRVESKLEFGFMLDCPSTVNQNIDDAIKLLNQENISMPEIKIGIIDSGIAKTQFTQDRLDGGYSFLEGYLENGTDDRNGHGTLVAGTIIQNTLNNARLYSYQITNSEGSCLLSVCASAIYTAVTDGCRILNNSYAFTKALPDEKKLLLRLLNMQNDKMLFVWQPHLMKEKI